MERNAIIDSTGKYRYSLSRTWDTNLEKIIFILLNPSTADAYVDDNTVKKCIKFAETWKFGSLEIVNLFAYRATDPRVLITVDEPIGKENDRYILESVKNANKIVVGWGNKCCFSSRDIDVLNLLSNYKLYCLDINKTGKPKHPLYVAENKELKIFK